MPSANKQKKKAQRSKTRITTSIIHVLLFKQKRDYFGWDTKLFSNIRGVSCLLPLSPPHLSAIWHWISRLFLQRLPLLGCITAQTPNLLRRLWPHWNASTNTQPLPLLLSLLLSVLCIFFSLKLSCLSHRRGHTHFVRRWELTGGSGVTAAKSSF